MQPVTQSSTFIELMQTLGPMRERVIHFVTQNAQTAQNLELTCKTMRVFVNEGVKVTFNKLFELFGDVVQHLPEGKLFPVATPLEVITSHLRLLSNPDLCTCDTMKRTSMAIEMIRHLPPALRLQVTHHLVNGRLPTLVVQLPQITHPREQMMLLPQALKHGNARVLREAIPDSDGEIHSAIAMVLARQGDEATICSLYSEQLKDPLASPRFVQAQAVARVRSQKNSCFLPTNLPVLPTGFLTPLFQTFFTSKTVKLLDRACVSTRHTSECVQELAATYAEQKRVEHLSELSDQYPEYSSSYADLLIEEGKSAEALAIWKRDSNNPKFLYLRARKELRQRPNGTLDCTRHFLNTSPACREKSALAMLTPRNTPARQAEAAAELLAQLSGDIYQDLLFMEEVTTFFARVSEDAPTLLVQILHRNKTTPQSAKECFELFAKLGIVISGQLTITHFFEDPLFLNQTQGLFFIFDRLISEGFEVPLARLIIRKLESPERSNIPRVLPQLFTALIRGGNGHLVDQIFDLLPEPFQSAGRAAREYAFFASCNAL
ncbi:MAG: hypothetical protein S4CHLAM102_08780 [Chlamydiia bacterium]|nr:hypothetical protein [Chlamydiia bacterium]